MEERIYAGIASALKAAAAQRTPTKTASQVGGMPAASSATGMGGSPLQQHLSGELGGAAVVSAEHLGVPTASSVAAAVQELAAATAADQQGQQLLQQIHQLEREVEAMKQTVAAHTQQSSSHQQDSKQQLQEQQQRTAALATELQELKQRQREQQQQRPATPVMEELLADLREQAQQQIADIGRQQVQLHVLRQQSHVYNVHMPWHQRGVCA
jgi:flagellar biosynthesis GTPase FlhF